MTYKIEVYPPARDQIRALPTSLLGALAEVFTFLELEPWAGRSYVESDPTAKMRKVVFGRGAGVIIYLILEDQLRVDVLKVVWLD